MDPKNTFQWNWIWKSKVSIQENAIQNVVYEKAIQLKKL